jgi:serine phosphatase RsbU (regulator of sigma subunit)
MTADRADVTVVAGTGETPHNGAVDGQEIDLAEQIQQLLLPKSYPLCTWCCIGVKNRMAAGLGGDYFDFITMPDGCQSLFIGDVTGHGLHASVVMSLLYGFMHRAALGSCSPLELVQEVNDFLLQFARRSQVIDQYFSSTLFYGIIQPQALQLQFVNAGHVRPLVLRRGEVLELDSTGTPVGYFETPEWKLQTFSLEVNDRLLLYTDGIIEAANAAGELFGLQRLQQLLVATAGADYLDVLEQIFQAQRDFGVADPPEDDCTAIVIDLHGPLPFV